jgi:hypothetical protein
MTDEEQIWLSAVRYCFGRKTYIVDTTVKFMTERVGKMSEQCRKIMRRDILTAIDNYGDSIDLKEWAELINTFEKYDSRI